MPARKKQNNFIQIGYTTKPHGLKGEVNAVFNYPQFPEKISRLRKVFLGVGENPIPYLIEKIYPSGKGKFYLTVSGIDSREKAVEITGCKIFVAPDVFEKNFVEKDTVAPGMLIGFTAHDEKEGEIGKVEDIFEMPNQTLAQIFLDGKEVLLPLNDATILQIDKKKKTIKLHLPDGLLDIF